MWWLRVPWKQGRKCQINCHWSTMTSFPLCSLSPRSHSFKGWNSMSQSENLQQSLIYYNVQIILVRILFCPHYSSTYIVKNPPIILSEKFYRMIHKRMDHPIKFLSTFCAISNSCQSIYQIIYPGFATQIFHENMRQSLKFTDHNLSL